MFTKDSIFKHEEGLIVGAALERFLEEGGVSRYDSTCVNPTSLDVRIGDELYCEDGYSVGKPTPISVVDSSYQHLKIMQPIDPNSEFKAWELPPKTFALAKTIEVFSLPRNVMATFTLRSVCARNGLDQCMSIDMWAGFNGVLVLELYNLLMRHPLALKQGDKIGQVKFTCHRPTMRYAGKYTDQTGITR